ncbi:MAG: hypothetical protein ABSB70_13795 [Candidatus Velthaea sp.]|jgi:peptide/nickel transport system substrate-binding protein
MRRLAVLLGLAALCALTPPAWADPQPATLRISLELQPDNLNPLLDVSTLDEFLARFAFDSLARPELDGTIQPILAAVVPTRENGGISPDGRTIVYKLAWSTLAGRRSVHQP